MTSSTNIGRCLGVFSSLLGVALLGGCAGGQQKESSSEQLDRMAFARPAPLIVKGVGFLNPAAAIYDAESDTYLVSNVNGDPLEKDKNGFISRVAPDGKVIELKWIDGSMVSKTLNAPKGMAVSDSRLFVADIDAIRIFHRTTGASLGVLKVPKATYLNGVSASPNGTVYVTDTGLRKPPEPKPDPVADVKGAKTEAKAPTKTDAKKDAKDEPRVVGGWELSGTDAVFQISKGGSLKKLIKGDELHNPSGLAADDQGVWVSSWLQPELYRVLKWGKRQDPVKGPSDQLQGMVRMPDGALLVASEKTLSVHIGHPGSDFEVVLDKARGLGGVGYDTKRRRALLTLSEEGALEIQELSGFEETSNSFDAE